ncbi:MAG: DNA polymerase III subunit [Candidatus Eisenbacteria sp.]|nr:DNA polymerase III subunit [Candidatus Eisenbacteria bacterium]
MDLFGHEPTQPPPQEVRAKEGARLFQTIRHQETAVRAMRGAWIRGKMPHALLLWGPQGVGKMRSAQALAQLLMCRRQPTPREVQTASGRSDGADGPCGACTSCKRVARFTHPDLIVVLPATRSTPGDKVHRALADYGQDLYHCLRTSANASIGIEQIRDLKVESSKARVEKGNRVVIIRDAERMTQEAAQAALKLIEEPLAGTYLVLTCRDPHQLLPTILSRCRAIRFRPLPREFVEQVIRERSQSDGVDCELDDAGLRVVARLAEGSLGRALSMLEDEVLALREWAVKFFKADLRTPAEVSARVRSLGRTWNLERAKAAVDLEMMWLEDLLLLSQGLPQDRITHLDRLAELQQQVRTVSVSEIKRRGLILEEMLQAIGQNVNLTLATETALLRLNRLVGERDLF